MEESSAVTQEPMFCPRMTGTAQAQVTAPVEETACNMPTEAEELCTIAVITVPASSPSSGLENFSRSGKTADRP